MLRHPVLHPFRRALRVGSLMMTLGVAACGGSSDDGGKVSSGVAKSEPSKDDAAAKAEAGDAKAEAGDAKAEAGDAKAEAGDAKAEAGDAKAEAGDAKAEAGDAKAEGDDAKAEAGDAKAEAGDDAKADEPVAPADPAKLIEEVKNKKTTDERALAALAEAETAGSKLRDVAKAALARGDKLFDNPERAKVFYEWASAKDKKYPDPEFALAKQAVVTGELDIAKKHLTEVKARGGKKLLGQIEYDATWEVLKDDPDVRKLLGG